jgi:FkbM family methyltransferase
MKQLIRKVINSSLEKLNLKRTVRGYIKNTHYHVFNINDLLHGSEVINSSTAPYFKWAFDNQPKYILDLGCNHGLFSLSVHHNTLWGFVRGIAYDASHVNTTRTANNFYYNGYSGRNLYTFHALLGEDPKTPFYIHSSGIANATIKNPSISNQWKETTVPPRRNIVEDWIALFGKDTEVDLMKIDIEGSEFGLLNDSVLFTTLTINKILLEYHKPLTDIIYAREKLRHTHRLVDYTNEDAGYAMFERINS